MKFVSIGEFSKKIGLTIQTLRNWDKTSKLKPNHISKSGFGYELIENICNKQSPKND